MFLHNLFARAQSPWDSQAPIREELFSVERLEEHARSLATAQAVTPLPNKGRSLAGQLAENEAALLDAYRTMTAVIDEGRVITPVADWPCFELSLRHGSAQYEITVENPNSVGRGVAFATLDESILADRPLRLRLVDDGATHRLRVRLG